MPLFSLLLSLLGCAEFDAPCDDYAADTDSACFSEEVHAACEDVAATCLGPVVANFSCPPSFECQ
ncbi:MAG: hypothetical protein V4850_29315 [Myxococcota bacterium]